MNWWSVRGFGNYGLRGTAAGELRGTLGIGLGGECPLGIMTSKLNFSPFYNPVNIPPGDLVLGMVALLNPSQRRSHHGTLCSAVRSPMLAYLVGPGNRRR